MGGRIFSRRNNAQDQRRILNVAPPQSKMNPDYSDTPFTIFSIIRFFFFFFFFFKFMIENTQIFVEIFSQIIDKFIDGKFDQIGKFPVICHRANELLHYFPVALFCVCLASR